MTKEQELELIIDVSSDFWAEKTAEFGSIYTDQHHAKLSAELKDLLHRTLNEAYKDEELAKQEWLDDYYQETSYGWRQQDLIDLYRFEK